MNDILAQVTEDAVDVVEIAVKHHSSNITTQAMALITLLKLHGFHPVQGASPAKRSYNNALFMDLLSVGSPTVQSNSPLAEVLPNDQNRKISVTPLDELSSLSLSSRTTSKKGVSPTLDLLDGFAGSTPAPENNGPAYPCIVAFDSSSVKVMFKFSEAPGNPQTTIIHATFTNLSSSPKTMILFSRLQSLSFVNCS